MRPFIQPSKYGGVSVVLNQRGEVVLIPANQNIVLEDVLGARVSMRAEPSRVVCETAAPDSYGIVRSVIELVNEKLKLSHQDVDTFDREFENLEDMVGQIRVSLNGGL